MTRTLRSFLSGWGWSYLGQLLSGRLQLPMPPDGGPVHFIFLVANHFEPMLQRRSRREALGALRRWCEAFPALGIKDSDGHAFRHTYFYPAEEYDHDLVSALADHCQSGFGEVEVQLHHGVDGPDTPENLEQTLNGFLARLAAHECLTVDYRSQRPGYAFVHGNWALGNSANGVNCGVDNEFEVLARTGAYIDCTLPSAPDRSQVAVLNSIYQCGRPLGERAPHRVGLPLSAGEGEPRLPILLQGPLLLDWGARVAGFPRPRVENGDLSAEFPPALRRFELWARANVHVRGRPEWIFIKTHTHGLVDRHRDALLGDPMKRFLEGILEKYGDGAGYRLHFATAREAANMIFAALDGRAGDPGEFRDYRYVRIANQP